MSTYMKGTLQAQPLVNTYVYVYIEVHTVRTYIRTYAVPAKSQQYQIHNLHLPYGGVGRFVHHPIGLVGTVEGLVEPALLHC